MSRYLVNDNDLIDWEKALRHGGQDYHADNIASIRVNFHKDREKELEKWFFRRSEELRLEHCRKAEPMTTIPILVREAWYK